MKRLLLQYGSRFLMWLTQRLAQSAMAELHPDSLESANEPYVDATPGITPLVLMAAFEAPLDQAGLNACMEGLRGCERIRKGMFAMLGQLLPKYGQEEASVRMMANLVYLGMTLEKMLSGTANASHAAPAAAPEVNHGS
jgi:hypothetical protein